MMFVTGSLIRGRKHLSLHGGSQRPSQGEQWSHSMQTRYTALIFICVPPLTYSPVMDVQLPELSTVYVADVRHNGWQEVPGPVLALPQLVVLNASDNAIENVAEGGSDGRTHRRLAELSQFYTPLD